jgi:hypothetical protein
MSRYKTIETYVDVEIDLEEFDNDDLLEELAARDIAIPNLDLMEQIWLKRRLGQDYQRELDDLIYQSIGKVV